MLLSVLTKLSDITDFKLWQIIILTILIFISITTILKFMFTSKKAFGIIISTIFTVNVSLVIRYLLIPKNKRILDSGEFTIFVSIMIAIILLLGFIPTIIKEQKESSKSSSSNRLLGSGIGGSQSKENILKAVTELASHKTGALITIENHISLDQFVNKAIKINSEVTKELLINIFTPNTPLHDGAVIVRGDRILCAGAYFPISKSDSYDKTMGSRHRAALGISEQSDSLTIIVSEETGDISVAYDSMLIKMDSQEKLLEYLNIYAR